MCAQYKKICITNRHLVSGDYVEQLKKVVASDVDILILREKDMEEEEYLELAKIVIPLCEEHGVECYLHSFVKVAKALNHPKIHLPIGIFIDMSEEDRKWFDEIGVSTHSVKEALLVEQMGATYITASHIYPTDCKKDLEPRGIEYLSETVNVMEIPVYALGGIHPDNAQPCIDTGCAGICMMSEYMNM